MRSRNSASTRCIGGARRDEEKARAKERIFSFRDDFGQWDPKNQRPELWNLYNARIASRREHPRLPDLQLDRARRLAVHRAASGSRSRRSTSRTREVVRRGAALVAVTPLTPPRDGETVENVSVRFRTVGDITCTCPVASTAATVEAIIVETAATTHHRARRHAPRRPDVTTRRWSCARRKATSDVGDRAIRTFSTIGVLRFITAGSVDDGKSTLIGRLLLRHQGDPRRPARRHRARRRSAAARRSISRS